MRTYNSAPV